MLTDCVQKLGKQLTSGDRQQILDSYTGHRDRGLSEYDASVEALRDYHRGLFDEVNQLRAKVSLPQVEYTRPQNSVAAPNRAERAVAEPSSNETAAAGPTRSWRAGSNQAQITFENELQRDLYDYAANESYKMTRRGVAGERSVNQYDTGDLARRVGISEDQLYGRAKDVYDGVKAQMKGVQDGENRTVTMPLGEQDTALRNVADKRAAREPASTYGLNASVVQQTPRANPIVNDNPPLRKVADDASRTLLTEHLPLAHSQDVYDGIQTSHKDGNLEINEFGAETMRRLLGEMPGDSGKPLEAVTLSAGKLNKLAAIANKRADEYVAKHGWTDEQIQPLRDFAGDLSKLAENGDHNIAYVYDDALPEEEVHREDLNAGRTDKEALSTLRDHPLFKAPGAQFNREYPNINNADKASEIAAKLITGQADKYGWDIADAEKKAFLDTWADGILRNNGVTDEASFNEFAAKFKRISQHGDYQKSIQGPDTAGEAGGPDVGIPEAARGTQGTGTEEGNAPAGTGQQDRNGAAAETVPTPDASGRGSSKVGRSIGAKAIERGLADTFGDTAGYDKTTVKEQAALAAGILTDPARVQRIIAGDEPLPKGLLGASLIKAVEDDAMARGDAQTLKDLANSPLTSETSRHAQEMRMMRERDPYSPVAVMQDVRNELIAKNGTKFKGKTPDAVVNTEVSKIQNEVQKAVKLNPKKWSAFIDSIQC